MNERYVLVMWPDIQEYMVKDGFNENSCLANDEYFVNKYGSSAYFVNETWYEKNS